jgi:hypothetical protein
VKDRDVDGAQPVAPEHVHDKASSQAINGIAERSGSNQAESDQIQVRHFWCSYHPAENADSSDQPQGNQDWRGAREQAPGGPHVGRVNQRQEPRQDMNRLIPLVTAWDVGDRPGFERLVQPDPDRNDEEWQQFHGSSIRELAEDWIVRTLVQDKLETPYGSDLYADAIRYSHVQPC